MKRLIVWGALAGLVWLVVRNMSVSASSMRVWCAEKCEQMLERMPESFPPNRMMADLDHLKRQTDRILDAVRDGP